MTLDDLVDHHQIRAVIETYCRGVDRRDKGLIDSVYWPDAQDDHGVYKGKGANFAEFLFTAFAHFEATMHVVAQSNIALNGGAASADTYFIAGHREVKAGSASFLIAWGRYVDLFEKRDGIWKIADRKVVIEHMEHTPHSQNGPMPIDLFHRGRHDHSDLSYAGRSSSYLA